MTDMDEAFNEIYRSILNNHLEVSKPLTLGILRKAKADGMREAADFIAPADGNGTRNPIPLLDRALATAILSNINWCAEKIETASKLTPTE